MFSRRTWIATLFGSIISFATLAANAQMISAIAASGPPNRSATRAFCLSAVYKGLTVANSAGATWQTTTDMQRSFLALYAPAARDLTATQKNVHAIATTSSAALENFFARHGFPGMKFPVNWKAVGTVFDVEVTWPVAGENTAVRADAGGGNYAYYRAAQMSRGVSAYQVPGLTSPLFKLATRQPGWSVYIIEADILPVHTSNLPAAAKALLARERTPSLDYRQVVFPIVDWQGDMDISFLQGMRVPNFSIDQAIGKAKLHLDEKGGHASSAAAIVSRGGRGPDVYEITKPFYVIFTKDGTAFPAFVALAGPDSWKKTAD